MKKGIDISVWQDNINYDKLKEQGIEFAIIRCGYGKNKSQKDKMFEKHYEGLKNAGIKIGVYHYSYMTSLEGAEAEANMCLEFINGKQIDLPVFYDLEENRTANLGKDVVTEGAIRFTNIIKSKGYDVGVYANLNWFTSYVNPYKLIENGIKIWLAQWNSKITADFDVDFWQYTSKGEISGIAGNVDLDYEIKENINPDPKPIEKTIEELANEVIEGKWGNGNERYERLTKAGYNYQEIQNKVNEILGVTKKLYYTIKWGDTLTRISNKFGVSINQLMEWNNIKDANKIFAGQLIRVK